MMEPSTIEILSLFLQKASLTAVVAIFGALIAYRQWETAREKLKIELFDRRLIIYEQTRDILAQQLALGQAFDATQVTNFGINVRVSRWLYDASIADYLQDRIVRKLQDLHDVESEIDGSIDQTQKQRLIAQRRQLRDWLEDQRNNVIDEKFGRYLHVNYDSIRSARINWRRGGFRLWLIFGVLWFAGVLSIALANENIGWNPWDPSTVVHIKISNTETWDYPAEWGVERIAADLKRRIVDEDKREHEWVAQVSAARKAECKSFPPTTKFEDEPSDCVRLFWDEMGFSLAVPQGWESQVRPSISAWRVVLTAFPWAAGLPLAVLLVGASLFWALAGFKHGDRNATAK